MTTNKKLVVTVGVMAVALVLALTGIIVVLVTANQRASSAVNVKYTSSDVAVTLSATAYLGSNSYVFTKGGVVGGETELVLSPTVTEGSLSQTSDIASFDLTKTNDYVVFEYVFANNTDTIDVRIDQDGIPATKENINLTYTYSDTQITNFATLEDNAEFTAQLLPAYTGEETVKYVYIKAQIADLLYDSSLVGDFGWALSKPNEADVNTVTLSVADADYVEREGSNLTNTTVTSDYTYRTLETSVDAEDISIYPAVANKTFVGWSETDGGTVISAIDMSNNETHNALRGTGAKTLYPVYKDATAGLTYTYTNGAFRINSSVVSTTVTEFVLPDYYYDGTNSGKVTSIADGSPGLLDGNTTVKGIVFGRYINYLGFGSFANAKGLESVVMPDSVTSVSDGQTFSGCTSLTSAVISNNVTYMGNGMFQGCTSLSSVEFSSGITSIGSVSFANCTNLTNITIPKSVTNIGINAFFYCTGLTSVNIPGSVYCISQGAFSGCTGITSLILNEGLVSLLEGAFGNCTGLKSIKIPSTVTSIESGVFYGCTGLLSTNGGSGITFEDTTTWEMASNITFTNNKSTVDVTDPSQNATWLVSDYQNYCWRKV